MSFLVAILGSRSVRIVGGITVAVSIAVGAIEGMLWLAGKRGEERALIKVERKANADTEVAHEVRKETPTAKRGKPDPHKRAD
mgnify:FL=1